MTEDPRGTKDVNLIELSEDDLGILRGISEARIGKEDIPGDDLRWLSEANLVLVSGEDVTLSSLGNSIISRG